MELKKQRDVHFIKVDLEKKNEKQKIRSYVRLQKK